MQPGGTDSKSIARNARLGGKDSFLLMVLAPAELLPQQAHDPQFVPRAALANSTASAILSPFTAGTPLLYSVIA